MQINVQKQDRVSATEGQLPAGNCPSIARTPSVFLKINPVVMYMYMHTMNEYLHCINTQVVESSHSRSRINKAHNQLTSRSYMYISPHQDETSPLPHPPICTLRLGFWDFRLTCRLSIRYIR